MSEATIWAISGYGANTRQPFVTIKWKDNVIQMSPAEAREHAMNVLEAAEAAELDAFLMEWTKEKIIASDDAAVRLLAAYREWRQKRLKGPNEQQTPIR